VNKWKIIRQGRKKPGQSDDLNRVVSENQNLSEEHPEIEKIGTWTVPGNRRCP
jgi:hypothetical protein